MKKVTFLIVIISLIITACKSTQHIASNANDDVYYTSSKNIRPGHTSQPMSSDKPQIVTSPDSSATVKSGSSTWADDYNDYTYSSRIKRFSNTGSKKSYYDEAYTSPSNYDTTIFVDQDPDVNIYIGAGNSWGNCYNPSFSFGLGWGWGYDPWYGGWGYPYYAWPYWGGYGYGYGYWNGYWDGYWDGYYGYPPYYDYSYNNYYYGHRGATASNIGNPVERSQRSVSQQGVQQLERNDRTVTPERNIRTPANTNNTRSMPSVRESSNRLPSNQEKYHYTRTSSDRQVSSQRVSTQYQRQKEQPAPRYVKPNVTNQAQRTPQTQSYSSPVYRQPRSSQEYINPRTQNPGVSRVTNSNANERSNPVQTRSNEQRRYVSPGNTTRTIQNPVRTNGTPVRSYTPSPTNSRSSSPAYSTPSRTSSNESYSTPTRSSGSGTYSSPSRSSGGSYSAPSRSGGGSSSPSSGGGGRHR